MGSAKGKSNYIFPYQNSAYKNKNLLQKRHNLFLFEESKPKNSLCFHCRKMFTTEFNLESTPPVLIHMAGGWDPRSCHHFSPLPNSSTQIQWARGFQEMRVEKHKAPAPEGTPTLAKHPRTWNKVLSIGSNPEHGQPA